MKIFGSTTSPLEFCFWLRSNGMQFSLNEIGSQKIAVFDNILSVLKCFSQKTIKDHYVLVFDCKEKLVLIDRLVDNIVNSKHLHELKLYIKLGGKTDQKPVVVFKDRNYINESIEENKNSGIMHTYNTLLYKIKTKDLRDKMTQLILRYASGKIDQKQITKFTDDIKTVRRNEATKTIIQDISLFIQSEEFGLIKKSLKELLKSTKKPTNQQIEIVALKNGAEPYDVRYLFHVINR